jgi:hypothetical protein
MPNQRACDRCHKYKEKCEFKDHAEECALCERAGVTCTTLRSQSRQGRRPKATPLGPNSSVRIWEPEVVAMSISTNQLTLSAAAASAAFEGGDGHSPAILNSHGQIHISELNHFSITPSPHKYHLTILEEPFDTFMSPWDFYARHDLFMIGPSFAKMLRSAVQESYVYSPVLLNDILLAISPAVDWARHKVGMWNPMYITRGATALQKLRTARVSGIRDAFAIIALGQTLAAFDLLTCSVGPISIVRYSLSTIQPWYTELAKNPSIDIITITPIFWDTVHCLVKREVPVIKYCSRDPPIVDRMAGLCTTLLPILYRLCVVSNTLKCKLQTEVRIDTVALQQIEQSLLSWHPQTPHKFATTFTSQEILRMQGQASMYRTAGMLVCHRLSNPIGTLDDIALAYANSIMLEFSEYSASLTPGTTLQNITFPILMASFEITDISREIWQSIPLLAAAPILVTKTLDLVDYVWRNRDCGTTSFLFDLIDSGPDFIAIF